MNTDEGIAIHHHAVPVETVFATLSTSVEGLPQFEANRRLEKYGANRLPEIAKSDPKFSGSWLISTIS